MEQEEDAELQNDEANKVANEAIPDWQNDSEGRVLGQLPEAEQSTVKDYHSIKRASKDKIVGLVGHEVTVGNQNSGTMKWKVITTYEPPDGCLLQDISTRKEFGLKNLSTMNHK